MSSLVIAGDSSGSITLQAPSVAGSVELSLPTTSGALVNTAPGISGNVLTSDGTDWTSAPLKINHYLITDSTDIALTEVLGTGQQNVGSSISINIPVDGTIKLANISGRFLNSATASNHAWAFGIRIDSVNYWFGQSNNNGTLLTTANACAIETSNTANAYGEFNSSTINAATYRCTAGLTLDVTNSSIPTGTQTVQLITAYAVTAGTIKGTVKQTRILLEVVG